MMLNDQMAFFEICHANSSLLYKIYNCEVATYTNCQEELQLPSEQTLR